MVFPGPLQGIYSLLHNICRESGIIAGKSGRHMKFPYTMSAKIAQFPYAFYLKNNNVWMYLPLAFCLSLYFIAKIHVLANSEGNIKNWAETQRRAAEKEQHH